MVYVVHLDDTIAPKFVLCASKLEDMSIVVSCGTGIGRGRVELGNSLTGHCPKIEYLAISGCLCTLFVGQSSKKINALVQITQCMGGSFCEHTGNEIKGVLAVVVLVNLLAFTLF